MRVAVFVVLETEPLLTAWLRLLTTAGMDGRTVSERNTCSSIPCTVDSSTKSAELCTWDGCDNGAATVAQVDSDAPWNAAEDMNDNLVGPFHPEEDISVFPYVLDSSTSNAESQVNDVLLQSQNRVAGEEVCCIGNKFNDMDVLFGRGEHVNRHYGNNLFHREKEILQPMYIQAAKRSEKRAIAEELVHIMERKYGSRFLGYCREEKNWHVISKERVLEKAKQVLRETFTPEQRKEKRERYFRPKKKLFYAQCLADLRYAKA